MSEREDDAAITVPHPQAVPHVAMIAIATKLHHRLRVSLDHVLR